MMVQYLQINKHNISHKQKDRQSHRIISIDARKGFDKVQHPFMIKTLSQVGVGDTYLYITKAIYKNLQPTSYPMGKN